jgi:hypothetical protein
MKKTLLAVTLFSLFALPMVILAQIESPPMGPTSASGVIAIVNTITNWIFTIFLAAAVIFIIMAAVQFLTSGGDPGKVANARNSLLYALVGVAVAVLAKALIALVRLIVKA